MYILFADFRIKTVFKTTWPEPPSEWWCPTLAENMRLAFHIRELFNNAIAGDNPAEFDVVVCAKPVTYEKIKVKIICAKPVTYEKN